VIRWLRGHRAAGAHQVRMPVLRVFIYLFFTLFLFIPLVAILLTALTGELVNIPGAFTSIERLTATVGRVAEKLTAEHLLELVTVRRYLDATRNSLLLSAAVALLCVVLTLPVAYGLARTALPAKWLIGGLALFPLILPSFIAADGFMLMFGRVGWATQIYQAMGGSGVLVDIRSWVAVLITQTLTFSPFALLPMTANFKLIDPVLEEAGQSLGAHRLLTWLTVTAPLAGPGIAASALLVFVITLSDFGAPVILAPRQFPLLSVEAYREMSGYFNWAGAATLALALAILASFFLYLQRSVLRRGQYAMIAPAAGRRGIVTDRKVTMPLFAYALAFLSLPIAIVASVALQSFSTTWGRRLLPDGYTLKNYAEVLSTSPAIYNSLLMGLGALVVSLVIGAGAAYLVVRGRMASLDFVGNLPLAIPGVALGIALILTFNSPPVKLTGTAFLLICAYALRRLPHMLRTTAAAITQVKRDLEEAGLNLGATPGLMIWTVVAPLVLPGIIAGCILVFVTVIKEISITVLLAPARWGPMSLEVFRHLLRGEFYLASAMAMLIVVIVAVLQFAAQRLAGEKALF